MHDTHAHICLYKAKRRQVTTTILCQLCSIQSQKEVKYNPKTAQV